MTGLKIGIMLLFLICFIAAGHGGGPFIMLEIGLIFNVMKNSIGENSVLAAFITLQVTWFIALKHSHERLMFGLVIALCLIVIAATIVSKETLNIVIWPNASFLIVSVIYIIRYFKNIDERQIDTNEEILIN